MTPVFLGARAIIGPRTAIRCSGLVLIRQLVKPGYNSFIHSYTRVDFADCLNRIIKARSVYTELSWK